ncbi:hypothetical protein BT93_L1227 [Corymbia citriodora subsp. variegata]|uniref:Uncharacterized protein n=1 Tax=Corymbia citriodora subsp. variegata TaxID=360336 RepID=A0A8T0CSP3_CORYI|nr:hypothetical protein BT93_L1227 [Corymbia citriodora subsp. variegata]
MSDAVLLNMKLHGRIAAYNLEQPEGVHNLLHIIMKRVRMEGFNVLDYCHLYPKFLETVLPLLKEGRIIYVKDIAQGLRHSKAALVRLFSAHKKQVVLVSRE